jgi:hypothetical protein
MKTTKQIKISNSRVLNIALICELIGFIFFFILTDLTIFLIIFISYLIFLSCLYKYKRKRKKQKFNLKKYLKKDNYFDLKRFIILESIFLAIIIFIIGLYFYAEVKYPYEFYYAGESVKLDCEVAVKLQSEGNFSAQAMKDAGSGGFYNSNNKTITILVDKNSSYYKEVYIHELCHSKQILPNSCAFKPIIFMHEFQCYREEKIKIERFKYLIILYNLW